MAKYLLRHGHDVRVLTARDQPLPRTLPVEVPDLRITATDWIDVNRVLRVLFGGKAAVQQRGYSSGRGGARITATLRRHYTAVVHMPDAQLGWVPFACAAGKRLIRSWRPDVIVASSAPRTSLIVAATLAKRYSIPWVAEFRDLWFGNHAEHPPVWRRWLDERFERRLVSSAAGIIAVSEPLADQLRARYPAQPVECILNGFDPSDYAVTKCSTTSPSSDEVTLVYTGMLYPEHQNIAPLLDGISEARQRGLRVRARFYGRYLMPVRAAAVQRGLQDAIQVYDHVPRSEAIAIQQCASALLLFLWSGSSGVYTTKLFEYMGARRPIIAVGDAANDVGKIVRELGVGVVAETGVDVANIIGQLATASNPVAGWEYSAERVAAFTREHQARRMSQFLQAVLSQ